MIAELIFWLIIFGLSVVIHEYAHAWMANRLGDPTAKDAGRLTLNPIAHIDPFGTVILPLILFFASGGSFLFAYAKPVPFNPYNLRDQKYGPAKIALAGPASNFMIAIGLGFLLRILPSSSFTGLLSFIVYANVLLAVFNSIPIPPLDGSKLLFAILPASLDNVRYSLERYGFVILLIFFFFGFRLILPIIFGIFRLITGFSLF